MKNDSESGDHISDKQLKTRLWCVFSAIMFLNASVSFNIYRVGQSLDISAQLSYQSFTLTLETARGTIYDRNGIALTNDITQTVAVFTPEALNDERLSMYLSESEINMLKSGRPVSTDVEDGFYMDGAYTAQVNRSGDNQPAHLIGYADSDGKGVCGVESAFDDILRGGELLCAVRRDALGSALSQGASFRDNRSNTGSVSLTIDSDWQTAAYNAAKRYIKRGAVVVLDNSTAEILASVSLPDYKRSAVGEYLDREDAPFINRALTAFPVGSVFKISTAAAALEAGISPEYTCTGAISLANVTFGCMNSRAHGACNMCRALGVSCNTYFVALSERLSAARMLDTAKLLGFGSEIRLCSGIGSSGGTLPELDTLKIAGEKANFAFGQGSLTATPLQIASTMQTVCNSGGRIVPTLIKSVTDKQGNTAEYAPAAAVNAMSKKTAATLKEYLKQAAISGTAASGRPDGLTVGGKTATAETGGALDVWFAGFCEEYGVSIAVLCEDGSSGSENAAPVFRELLSNIAR